MVKVNNLTWLSTISSARISFMVHPPPMRNEIFLPTIRKQGEMRVPWGGSPLFVYSFPAGSLSLGRFSAPPIHQSPCCWALSLSRAAGLSPNVGCWMKAVPVISHPPIPSSKSRLQASEKEKRGSVYPAEYSTTIIRCRKSRFRKFVFNYFYCSMRRWTLKDIYNEILYRCIQLDKCHCYNRNCCCRDSVRNKINSVL